MKKVYNVLIHPENMKLKVEEGCTILEAVKSYGILINAPCGGNGLCNKCRVQILEDGVRKDVFACNTNVTKDIEVWISNKENHRILLEGRKKEIEWNPIINELQQIKGSYMAAFDIGTTTIAGYLINGKTGEEEGKVSLLNPQASYGADIMERCRFSKQNGIEILNRAVISGVNEMLFQLAKKVGIETEDIVVLSVAGNPCMNHIFANIPIDSLLKVPYKPAFYSIKQGRGKDFQLNINKEALVLLLPNIGGFVGSDMVMSMLCADIKNANSTFFLIDIGTNGEMVIGSRDRYIACSTAAGPAFEGISITYGMRGANGAIDHVVMEQGQISITTIEGDKPIGICGSGLIDAVAMMLTYGFIDPTGRILEREELLAPEAKKNQRRICEVKGEKVFLLVSPAITGNEHGIYISQQDIRELQLAKGAILAGIHTLLNEMELIESQIETIFLAGAFGFYLNIESACKIGMLPTEWKNKIQLLGNAAGEGAKEVLMNKEKLSVSEELAKRTIFMELASSKKFQEEFLKCMDFPE